MRDISLISKENPKCKFKKNGSTRVGMADESEGDNSTHSSSFEIQVTVDNSETESEVSSNVALGSTIAQNKGVFQLTESGLNQLNLVTESSPNKSSSHLSSKGTKLSLAPSPTFKTKSSPSYVVSDPEENHLQSRRFREFEGSSTSESVLNVGSKDLNSSTSSRNRPLHSQTVSNAHTSPLVKTRSRSPSNLTSNQSISKRHLAPPVSHPQTLETKFNVKKQIDNKSENSSPLRSSIHIPTPPSSISTYLQLELSAGTSSFVHRPSGNEPPYESTHTKFQRLQNLAILPLQLEQILLFGSFACLDAWLHTFTILPLRFLKATAILAQLCSHTLIKEVNQISSFIYYGSGRMWCHQRKLPKSAIIESHETRQRKSSLSSYPSHTSRTPNNSNSGKSLDSAKAIIERRSRRVRGQRNYMNSQPTPLSTQNKADLIQGTLIILGCLILMKLDASRMYHYIRGQAAIKLYVIFNVLEVGDKLLASLGQDIFECLFSNEILNRDNRHRSWLFQPFYIFVLALVYNIIHAAALLFQVITLNVAVNSYSNALFTLLMSNQFVEIKSTVFKKIEKDNLFQLTCADVVERFQLWIILIIIALRNFVEMGSLSISSGGMNSEETLSNNSRSSLSNISVLPNSFSQLHRWSGEILSPFFFVLGSEMLVDWIKHSYISKFNNVKPTIYGRYLDVLAKDYYTNAFINQNLVKRFGLPVIPLACLFIRSSVQTYHMLIATYLPPPKPPSAIKLSVDSVTTSPATTAALERFDNIIRHALGRSTYGIPDSRNMSPWYKPNTDDLIATLTMVIFFLCSFLFLLAFKLVLGMLLLRFSHKRFLTMRLREHQNHDMDSKRIGVWGMTELDDEKKRWIYQDDPKAITELGDKQKAAKQKTQKRSDPDFSKISRYDMLKRIW